MRGTLTLKSGRTIQLVSLHQEAVYAGLLEGLPTREMNARAIDRIRREARERARNEPLLIEPAQTPIEHSGKYPFGDPAMLPSVACIAEFVSSDDTEPAWARPVIWFQDDFAFPISPEAEASITALDWWRDLQRTA